MRRIAIEAWVIVPAMQIALWTLPFRIVHRFVDARRVRSRERAPAEIVAASIDAVPRASCLARVLAGALLLARHGHASTLRLGVTRSGATLDAHAWLESGGRPILGEPPPGTMIALR